ncbi:MAG: 4Fe-4S binding protein [Bacillota bacterium]|nr:4Fe-4S binding protein [Bacillota bacterium]
MKTFRIAKVLFKSLFKKPATLMYPVVQREWQERTRGSVDIHVDSCILCGICGRRCPADAIEVDRKAGTWVIHRMQCIQCGECISACPKKCLEMNNQYTEPQAEKVVDTFEVELAKDDTKSKAPAGDLVCKQEDCVYCGLCAKVCPADALKIDRKEKIWEVDKEACAKCGACVEKCPKKCLSLGEAPASEEKPAETGDEKLACNLDDCIYCGLCAKNCPCDALTVDRKEKVWKVDEELCVKCGACLEKCPKECLTIG